MPSMGPRGCIWTLLTLPMVTLTPGLITLWRQTDRDRLMWYLGGISAKLGHAKWRLRGLFSFNFNLHQENPINGLSLFDEQTTLQFGWFTNILKRFSIKNINKIWSAKARKIEFILSNQFDPHESQFDHSRYFSPAGGDCWAAFSA